MSVVLQFFLFCKVASQVSTIVVHACAVFLFFEMFFLSCVYFLSNSQNQKNQIKPPGQPCKKNIINSFLCPELQLMESGKVIDVYVAVRGVFHPTCFVSLFFCGLCTRPLRHLSYSHIVSISHLSLMVLCYYLFRDLDSIGACRRLCCAYCFFFFFVSLLCSSLMVSLSVSLSLHLQFTPSLTLFPPKSIQHTLYIVMNRNHAAAESAAGGSTRPNETTC